MPRIKRIKNNVEVRMVNAYANEVRCVIDKFDGTANAYA